MSGSKIILQATGEQNNYLNIGAKHTLFKKNSKRYTMFGLDWSIINANYSNSENFGLPGSNYYFRIDRNGDLINEIYLRVKLKKNDDLSYKKFNIRETLFNIINSIEILYDDKVLGKYTNDFIFSYFELNYNESEKKNLIDMFSYDNVKNSSEDDFTYLTIPIPLWFHKNPGNAFPLWALHNPNIGVRVSLCNSNLLFIDSKSIQDIEILVNFTQLTAIEKEQFGNKSLEYLIEIPDYLDSISISDIKEYKKISVKKTNFVKYMLWNIKNINSGNKLLYSYLDDLENATISFNGNSLVENAPGKYFNQVNRYMYFNSGCTLTINQDNKNDTENLNPVYTYSFALDPIKKTLSGHFSTEKFNDVTFEFNIKANNGKNREINIYLIKHNIIRISNGYLNLLYN
mgnify:CR=1 FL=1|tara:strand:+ start:670 stop:1872 length:1203 start_codon:yes stop_codon:yes gene_type:complete